MAWAGGTALSHPGDINRSSGQCCGRLGAGEGTVTLSCPETGCGDQLPVPKSSQGCRGDWRGEEKGDKGVMMRPRREEGRRKGCEGQEERRQEQEEAAQKKREKMR